MKLNTEHYNQNTDKYASYRPTYPESLFSWIANAASDHDIAWDCATGSGQAAIGLSKYFDKVIATDINQSQLDHTMEASNIEYRSASAESSLLEPNSISAITVACAVHWFDLNRFYNECIRVLKPNGILAVWTYEWPWIGNKKLDILLKKYKDDILGDYWSEVSHLYFNHYKTLDFPFSEFEPPSISIELDWGPEDLLKFLGTWSAPQRYLLENGRDSTKLISSEFIKCWRDINQKNFVRLPLYFRVGRISL